MNGKAAVDRPPGEKMERRRVLKGIAALALAERLGLLRGAWAAGRGLPPPGLQRIAGRVEVNGRAARQGMPVRPGDTVTTGPASEAIYVVGQDAYLQRESSTVSLSGDPVQAGLRVAAGKLLAVFGKGDKQIATPTATIGIRGTGCYIEAAPDLVYFCLCYGQAEITPHQDPARSARIETRHHDRPLYLHADGSDMMAPASVINHGDAELVLLESLVGRVPPFYGQPGERSY